jgi:hypothetical protein|nr:hypothetical protein [Candidatus Krumholzibacteria bacterium]
MEFLAALWLPVVLSAVFVFIASSVIHMATPLHKNDYTILQQEDQVLATMREAGVRPGHYMFPRASSMKEMSSPEHLDKMNRGPVGFMTILPSGPVAMGKNLGLWFLFSLIVSVFTAYLTSLALAPGAHYLAVFRIAGTVAVLGHAVTHIPDSIWKGLSWGITAKFIFSGIIYGLVTAGTFAWLWPST